MSSAYSPFSHLSKRKSSSIVTISYLPIVLQEKRLISTSCQREQIENTPQSCFVHVFYLYFTSYAGRIKSDDHYRKSFQKLGLIVKYVKDHTEIFQRLWLSFLSCISNLNSGDDISACWQFCNQVLFPTNQMGPLLHAAMMPSSGKF